MGRRKERRLAAISAAGRRVKLDLFAEPSGDLGASVAQDEVGGDDDSKNPAGLPNSPSSSGGFRQFSSKGLIYVERTSCDHIILVEIIDLHCTRHVVCPPKILFSDCRVAVVLGTFNWSSDHIRPCHCVSLNETPDLLCPFSRHQRRFGDSTRILFVLGQQLENPLLLLGQYSDDELVEESSEGLNDAIVEDSPADLDDQVKVADGKKYEGVEINAGKELAAQKIEQHDMENGSASLEDALQKLEENGTRENDATDSGDLHREMDSTELISVPTTSDIQVIGDVSLGWKIVLHEESNRYYYWNTLTGETSWEVPDLLVQETQLTCEQKNNADSEGKENAVASTHTSNSTLDVELGDDITTQPSHGSNTADLNCEIKDIHEHRPEMEVWNEGYKGDILEVKEGALDVSKSDIKHSSGPNTTLHHETSSGGYVSSSQSFDALLGNGSATAADSEKLIPDLRGHGEHEIGTNLSSRLVQHSEYLLERLKSLGFEHHLLEHDRISKYMLEVEIRLSDIKSLLSYGSSLIPFWVHSERQLKRTEAAINDEIFQFHKSAQMSEAEATHKSQDKVGDDIKADANEKISFHPTSEDSHASNHVSIVTDAQKKSCSEDHNDTDVKTEHVPSVGSPATHSCSGAGGKGEVHGVAIPAELTPNTVLHCGEDVDMDVDMEVEDAIPRTNMTIGDALGAEHHAPPEQPILPNPPAEHETLAAEGGVGVPPPPDEDWIPPPPPDNELFPPPPPDEPPEPEYPAPPPDSDTMQPFSYSEQYNLSYTGSNLEYYGQTSTEVPGSNFYAHAEGCQIAVPHQPLYYAAVPNIYPGAASVLVNPVEPVAYYGLQDGTVATVPVASAVESSGFCSESGHENQTSQIGLSEAHAEPGCTSLPSTKVDVYAVGGETERASGEVPFAPASVQTPATISVTESASVSSSPAVTTMTVAATATVPKVQSKVSRNKRRTVAVASTLRSNKKVSSLVDKWKAAKEELHEDEEDEPENAYEILEKKRRREIEEWRAQQIASGEAKDNANFQPLGGDWRERVKRKRARLMKEAVQTPAEGVADGNQQPDLIELSRDLPSGWQAYWDESSKQVYYGNAETTATTWIRPTN